MIRRGLAKRVIEREGGPACMSKPQMGFVLARAFIQYTQL